MALRERAGGKDKQKKNYISQLPINRPKPALLVIVIVIAKGQPARDGRSGGSSGGALSSMVIVMGHVMQW